MPGKRVSFSGNDACLLMKWPFDDLQGAKILDFYFFLYCVLRKDTIGIANFQMLFKGLYLAIFMCYVNFDLCARDITSTASRVEIS